MKTVLDTRSPQERRLFLRIGLNFPADVSIASSKRDRVRLMDVSGNGVRFTSLNPAIYEIGQTVNISIHLPGETEVNASMEGLGRVVRIQPGPEAKMASIAICLDTPLRFVRSI